MFGLPILKFIGNADFVKLLAESDMIGMEFVLVAAGHVDFGKNSLLFGCFSQLGQLVFRLPFQILCFFIRARSFLMKRHPEENAAHSPYCSGLVRAHFKAP